MINIAQDEMGFQWREFNKNGRVDAGHKCIVDMMEKNLVNN
jgi:hypothetical protein